MDDNIENSIKNIESIKKELYDDDNDIVVRDVISDLMHWCKRNDVSFEDELRVGTDFYNMETDKDYE